MTVIPFMRDNDPEVKRLYDGILAVIDREEFKEMSMANIVGVLEFVKIALVEASG